MAVLYTLHCLRCGQDFFAKSETPGKCSKCQSPNWDTVAKGKQSK